MSAEVGTPGIAMRSYLSTHHLWAAEHFTRLAAEPSCHGEGCL
jgi:hypothetical protein